jgi:flagellar protein FliS
MYQTQTTVLIMFGQHATASTAYGRMAVESAALGADQHQLISILFNGVITLIAQSRAALARGDLSAKVDASSRAIRLIDEGLKTAVNRSTGEIGESLFQLYEYCTRRLLQGHLKHDDAAYAEVEGLITQIAEAWRAIAPTARAAVPGASLQRAA